MTLDLATTSLATVNEARALVKVLSSAADLRAMQARVAQKLAAEESLRHFVEQAWPVLEPGTEFIPGVHVDAVCEHLQAMIEDRTKDLIVNIPAGFAKSMICAVFMPGWVWIRKPDYRFLVFRRACARWRTDVRRRLKPG